MSNKCELKQYLLEEAEKDNKVLIQKVDLL